MLLAVAHNHQTLGGGSIVLGVMALFMILGGIAARSGKKNR